VGAGLFVAHDNFGVLNDGSGGIGNDAGDGAADNLCMCEGAREKKSGGSKCARRKLD